MCYSVIVAHERHTRKDGHMAKVIVVFETDRISDDETDDDIPYTAQTFADELRDNLDEFLDSDECASLTVDVSHETFTTTNEHN